MLPQQPLAAVPLISLDNVALHAQGEIVAGPVNWTLYRGERWAIVGPTGSGKSLLAATLAGRLPPDSGTVSYHLDDHANLQAHQAIAYVTFNRRPGSRELFHQARWHAALEATSPRVSEILTHDAPDARWDRITSLLALDDLLDRRLHYLSDGEWRRVQIAKALLTQPKLLILDDPFTGLDTHFRRSLHELVTHLIAGDTQVLIVASTPDEVPDSVTHILLMAHGKVKAQGPKATVLPSYLGAESDVRTWSPERLAPATAGDAPPIIEMRDVTVVHNEITVLQDITWTVRRGERWGLIGPNGAGKSTLLSLILGDHPQAYANRIALFGRPRGSGESIWEIKRRIGWVAPELHRYHPPLSSASDVVCSGFFDTLGLHRRPSADQESAAAKWMAHLGIQEASSHPFRDLPKGVQRLTLIARALVKEPELLILDEPCQGLDATQRGRVLDTLDRLLASSDLMTTLIYVTHRTREFPQNLTHLLELRQGRMVDRAALR